MSGAAVTFDGAASVFHVVGQVNMVVDYDQTILGTNMHSSDSVHSKYQAEIFWDGSQPVVVTIRGVV